MIIECKKKIKSYKPVKGNELELIKHLLNQNFYRSYSINACSQKIDGKMCRIISFEIVEENWRSISFDNVEDVSFKCGKDGEIHIAKDKYNFKNYVAVPFNENADLRRLFTAPNFESFTRDGVKRLMWKKWVLKTTTETFAVSYNDIIIFDENWEIVDCLMNGQNKEYESLLACNDYMVERDD